MLGLKRAIILLQAELIYSRSARKRSRWIRSSRILSLQLGDIPLIFRCNAVRSLIREKVVVGPVAAVAVVGCCEVNVRIGIRFILYSAIRQRPEGTLI